MQFLVLARDGQDAEAPARRLRWRPQHLDSVAKLKATGNFILGGAILDEQGAMVGSAAVFEFADRSQLEAYLARDPYVSGQVWQHYEVHPFRVANVEASGG